MDESTDNKTEENSNISSSLEKLSSDLPDIAIERNKPFYRHFVIHESDTLALIHLAVKGLKSSEDSLENKNKNQPGETVGGALTNSNFHMEGNRERAKEPFQLKKKIRKILKNHNLSIPTKAELIEELIIQTKKRETLDLETRKRPNPRKYLKSMCLLLCAPDKHSKGTQQVLPGRILVKNLGTG